jgi:hypothetical protein
MYSCAQEKLEMDIQRLQEEHKSFVVSIKESIHKKLPFSIKNINFTPPHYLKQSIERIATI